MYIRAQLEPHFIMQIYYKVTSLICMNPRSKGISCDSPFSTSHLICVNEMLYITCMHTNAQMCTIIEKFHQICLHHMFTRTAVNLMVAQWKPDTSVTQWTLPKTSKLYQLKFDDIFEQLTKLSYTDDLLAG